MFDQIIFCFAIFLALYGGPWIINRARKNNLKDYRDDG